MKFCSSLAAAVAVLLLAGCGTADPGAAPAATPAASGFPSPSASSVTPAAATPSAARTASPTPTPTPTEPAADVTVAVTISDGKVSPSAENVRLKRGQTVLFTLSSDVEESIHIHGYDKTLEAKPGGATTSLRLVADQRGAFDVETHETPKLVVKLIVA